MGREDKIVNNSNLLKRDDGTAKVTRTIYYGEVVLTEDPTDGGRIKVKILDLDNKTGNADLPWCYPLMPKFFHIYPKIGECVRVFIEDIKYPQRSRFWEGPVISQPQRINFDSILTALDTTNMALNPPAVAVSTLPNAVGVYPLKEDIAIVGRVNTDVILRINQVQIRAGKHENGDVLTLNTKNPASLSLIFEPKQSEANYYSNTIIMSDKIGIISHDGKPQFKAARQTPEDRIKIFEQGHPMVRGDVLFEILNIFRNALIGHIHPYSKVPADKEAIISALEGINFEAMLQKNIVIN